MLNYHQVYRVETDGFPAANFPLVTGAAHVADDTWVFWREAAPFNAGDQPVATLFLSKFTELPGGVIEATERSAPDTFLTRRFIPLTREYVRQNPAAYGLTDVVTLESVTANDANFYMYFKGFIPDYYGEMFDDSAGE